MGFKSEEAPHAPHWRSPATAITCIPLVDSEHVRIKWHAAWTAGFTRAGVAGGGHRRPGGSKREPAGAGDAFGLSAGDPSDNHGKVGAGVERGAVLAPLAVAGGALP